ncbi:MAG: mobile mystery protein A [Chlorobium limicola]|uniref:Mobile mystery protein A n=1 Tax=Chlorobium limicola (strain DSM 245 / NBRC 103803 / 6330) TaxID=290315 RepID=B3EHA5_CHLL2|nr:mobile mystery protein A [Chlorobium limicola]ACD91267.1 mobile mystery protein A [Chlorobium limicola DSM 245]NTV08803.1 mobile mystery protein A [Chlorobium limicola]
MKDRSLQREHLNEKMRAFNSAGAVSHPPVGWIHAIRTALGMSMQQLGKRLGVTKQNIQNIERREKDGAITIKSLRELGAALDMRLVYGFVPNDGTLDALVDRKARELAEKIVRRTAQSMRLEAQQNSTERIEKAIGERAEEIKREMPKLLWD